MEELEGMGDEGIKSGLWTPLVLGKLSKWKKGSAKAQGLRHPWLIVRHKIRRL